MGLVEANAFTEMSMSENDRNRCDSTITGIIGSGEMHEARIIKSEEWKRLNMKKMLG